ncbi:MAG: hypothetical protein H7141_11760 [Burkholderiales bacterium]|nr:hypothetical protein [Bacteroidia bacterium]
MNRIDIYNYEAYLLDFSEGNLGGELQMELELFLIQHPELNVDLSEVSLVELDKEEICFPKKNNLKKSESDLISEIQFISYIENQIPLDEGLIIEKSCASNPSLTTELSLYQQTISRADLSITYSDKNKLKRRPGIIWFDFSIVQYASAACVLFLIGLFVLWPKLGKTNFDSQLAEHKKITPSVKENNALTQKKEADSEIKTEPITIPQNSNKQKKINTRNNASISKENLISDTIGLKPDKLPPIEEIKKNEPLIGINNLPTINPSNQTVVQVITENEEASDAINTGPNKNGLWALAIKALKNLNKVGVKSVNGNEDENKDKTSYALTLGGLNITHKVGNL